ncbi:MAG: CoA transferase [Pyrobaculum sp.]
MDILEVSTLYPGPLVGRLLCDLGFSVIKVEPPGGDPMRELSPTLYKLLNEDKDVVYIDLRSAASRAAFYQLARRVKAVVTTFRPSTIEKLEVGYSRLSSINPPLVYIAITGFKDLPGHDINFAAAAGHVKWGPPVPQSVDVATGLLAALMAVAKVLKGEPGYFEISMEDVAMFLNLLNYALVADWGLTFLTGEFPFYNIYRCKGGAVALGAVEKKFWERFVAAIKRPELTDKMFNTEAVHVVREAIKELDCTSLEEVAHNFDIPLTRVRDIKEVYKAGLARISNFLKSLRQSPS